MTLKKEIETKATCFAILILMMYSEHATSLLHQSMIIMS